MADLEAEKARAAVRAVEEVKDGMLIGLGTGSTAAHDYCHGNFESD